VSDQEIWTIGGMSDDFDFEHETAAADDVVTVDYKLAGQVQGRVNKAIDEHARRGGVALSREAQRQLAMQLITADLEAISLTAAREGYRLMTNSEERALRVAVMQAMFGLGRIAGLLADPGDIEDIYISGTDPVIVKFAGGRREIREPIAESVQDLMDQLSSIATHHGQNARAVTSARPWLDVRLPGNARLAAVWDITPTPRITIRRHRHVNVTLERLVGMGTVSPAQAAFLQAAVVGRRSILVVGGQSVGKTTLLRALAQCLPRTERFATLETEYELLLHELPDNRFPGIMPYEARSGMGEIGSDGKPAGEVTLADIFPTSLRHSLDRMIVGEVRGNEVVALLQAMSRGYKGSMGTFHADSAVEAFESLASLLSDFKPNWSHAAAMQQIATAVDLIVFIDREDTEEGEIRYVPEILEVLPTVAKNGLPTMNMIFGPKEEIEEFDPRGYLAGRPADPKWTRRAGLDPKWLDRKAQTASGAAVDAWLQPFPRRWNAGWGAA
jgi:Flp pilus assembly CpaF family ATPase